ncbi:hypothetical protein [Nocardia stercoris]|uniref:hypothetical protein n=1 Tax=Nocardia stercoris TaxID=2483361 RepID=UPI0018F4839D|nr:hypothetical protein [Nocardia stercoris]
MSNTASPAGTVTANPDTDTSETRSATTDSVAPTASGRPPGSDAPGNSASETADPTSTDAVAQPDSGSADAGGSVSDAAEATAATGSTAAVAQPDSGSVEPGGSASVAAAQPNSVADQANSDGATSSGAETAAQSDPVADDPAAPSDGPATGSTRRFTLPGSPKSRALAARAAVALLLGAALCTSVILFVQNKHNRDLLAAHDDAQAAACKYAPTLATYDAKNLDAYFGAVLAGATGDWKTQFDSTSKDLRDVLTAGQVVSKVTDVQCAVRTGDTDSAEAIVVIGQTITSVGTNNQPKPGQLSMVMRLQRAGGRWLVNKVDSPLAALNQR